MRPLQVIPEQPAHEQAVEALDRGVHLGRPRVRVEVHDAERGTGLLEIPGELAPVVGLELLDRERAHDEELP